ncbi:diadenylate cyclase [Tautonia plasticadhaerens]|uniref:Diadenylate cyclase n=1 Tax=Tautonia plasticadhaerens TaxID=2527974 RepID=A0A518HF24_9BACT|nr:diadenylate cyclase [Tautonia plasticadhaerens]QDV39376.1 DisA bacterial checkpoint controller nucleotide-binding protein [Tautonia plasticadhaerens]
MALLPDPGWRDVADVLILSYLAHRLILLARGTRAPQVLLALAALWALWHVARHAGLELTAWFLGALNALAPVALIVVFRDEIRDVLVRSSPLRLLAGRPTRAGAIDLPAVAEAAFRLAASRTGALLAFEGRDRLDKLAREGTRVDARFSVPLVESLFAKGSPVHDGAALVRGGRIDRVGTFLPLSTRDGLPAAFGTRHRAAVGLSERCDAVVLVVSEERGEVALARDGRVEPIASPEELERALDASPRVEAGAEAHRGRAPRLVSSAAGFLLTTLAVATLWALYDRQQVARRTVTASVNFRGLPESLELIDPPEAIDLQLRGKRTLIDGLSPDRVTISVDLSGAERGGRYAIERGDMAVELPVGVEWSRADPGLSVRLGERVELTLPVRPRLEGRPPPGFAFTPPRVEPATVTVRVPRGMEGRLEAVETRPIDVGELALDAATREATVEVPLELGRIATRPAAGSADTVRVTVGTRPAAAPDDPEAAP